MLSFAANLSMLFAEVDFVARFARASRAGFRAVECQFPYAYSKDALMEQLRQHQLVLVLHNLPAGDWSGGDRGLACLPDRVGEFQEGLGVAIEYAVALGCTRLNCLSGIAPAGMDREVLRDTFVDNLRFAAGELKRRGIALLIEPLNSRDVPGFFLGTTQQAVEIIRDAGADNLYLQFDVYHTRIMEGDIIASFERALGHIAHVQIADDPGRREPGTGAIDFGAVFQALERASYTGWVGCEYLPSGTTEDSLAWLDAYRSSRTD